MISRSKKTLVILMVTLFAFNLLGVSEFASAKGNTIHVYAGEKIQDAVNAANLEDTIVVHEGTYQEMVSVLKPLTLKGEGAVIETPNLYGFDIQAVVKVTGFKIRPLDNGKEHHVGIHFGWFYTGGAAIDNEVFPGFSVAGIAANGPSGIQIENNIIHSSGSGVWTGEGSSMSLVGNIIESDGFGIVGNGPNIKIVDNDIDSGPNGAGIYYALARAGYVIVENNNVQSEGTGVDVVFAAVGCEVSGNDIVAGYGGNGISIAHSADVVVENNVIQNTFELGRGMEIGGCSNVLVRKNKVSTVDIGIHFSVVTNGVVEKNEVYINNVLRTASYGIVFNTVSDCIAFDNHVRGGGWGMWAMWSDRITVKNNEFAPNDLGGVAGLYLSDVADSEITGNKITGDISQGINIDQGSNANNILRNTIAVTGDYGVQGINLASDTFGNFVRGNRISGVATEIQDGSGLNIIVP